MFLASYAIQVLAHDLPDYRRTLCLAATPAAWALFAADYALRRRLSGQRPRFVRTHWLDTLALVLPLLRPLRVVRSTRPSGDGTAGPGSPCTRA